MSAFALGAALALAGVALLATPLAAPPPAPVPPPRLGTGVPTWPGAPGGSGSLGRRRPAGVVRAGLLASAATALVVGLVCGLPAPTALALSGAVAVGAAEHGRGRRRRAQARVREQVDEALAVLGAELGAGRAPPSALATAAMATTELAEAAHLAVLGGDVAPALQRAARRPGAEALGDLAAAVAVAGRTGAPLTPVVRRLRHALAGRAAGTREAAEQLAPVQATARVLAVLPVAGLALGGALGVDTVGLLAGAGWGQACLLLAVGLVAAGLWWVDVMARRALS